MAIKHGAERTLEQVLAKKSALEILLYAYTEQQGGMQQVQRVSDLVSGKGGQIVAQIFLPHAHIGQPRPQEEVNVLKFRTVLTQELQLLMLAPEEYRNGLITGLLSADMLRGE